MQGLNRKQATIAIILYEIRIPRAITAILVGIALPISGLILQTFFRNPLAGPSILGVTSGASLGVAALLLTSGISIASGLAIEAGWILIIAASCGSILVLILILFLARKLNDTTSLLIIGVMVANFSIAMVSIWQFFSNPEEIQSFLLWTFGSLAGVSGSKLIILTILVMSAGLSAMLLAKNLNLFLLGPEYAQSSGVNLSSFNKQIIFLVGILAGGITAFCGPIGFVGIVIPYLARLVSSSSDHRILIPLIFFIGPIAMLLCDILAKLPGSQKALPINAITALLGTPVVVIILLRRVRVRF